jgi:hypothetical protein
MLTAPAGRAARGVVVATMTVFAALVATATPAAAHSVGGGALPAPPWLLAYLGAALVLATAATLRATWPRHRLHGFGGDADAATAGGPVGARLGGVHAGHLLGLALLVLVLVAAIVGPDTSAANVAPVAVLVIWWVGIPVLSLVAGDVMRIVNPFVPIVALVDRRGPRDRDEDDGAPSWTSAAFLGAFAWFFMAYHRPGSPRSLAVFLAAYALAALAGGIRWGRGWLATGEGFAGLSAAVALLSPWRRRDDAPPPGVTALMVVWLGSTAFDAFTSTPFWADVLGDSQGWSRTLFNTVGLVWITAIVGGVYLLALRLAERAGADAQSDRSDAEVDDEVDAPPALPQRLGAALVPLALGWFVAHDLTLLLFEGQNFRALVSDPIGEGWDLFGTFNDTIDYSIVNAGWVRWVQLLALAAGHVAAVVVVHDTALGLLRRRRAMHVTWAFAAAAAGSVVAAALMVLG